MRMGMEAYNQNQWYTTQTPLPMEQQASSSTHQPWSYQMAQMSLVWYQTVSLLPFYPPYHMGQVYALWFQQLDSFNPLSPYSSPLSPLESLTLPNSPVQSPPPSLQELDRDTREELIAILAEMRETRTKFWWLKGIQFYNLKEQFEKKFILKCPPEMVTCLLNFRQTTNPEVGKYSMVIIPTLLQLPSLDPMTSSVVHPMTQAPMS